ncbi:ABC transporter substrate-binding protein [Ornithinimicrobium avium]|uniref:Amino acid ABC transporter substrate-binding protein n=1 Tax=Ornithinimicrobium avium TaxID=2283195 RepID=A0A345NJA8_9MICO|nr:ABC transporter substrate-binding protein [Ornithinimicrobium avium]AXH95116.1 amino acid ABC transporter substrate-binding protein [Ornithinimicrobium avium]
MFRKIHVKAVAALSAVALLAACGSGADEPDAATTETQPADSGATESATDGTTETGAAGTDAAKPASFTFGYILPETGALAYLGPPQIKSLELAIKDINDAGGVLGAEIPAPIGGDEGDQATIAQASADRILGQGVSAIIGAAASGRSLDIIDRITGAGVMQCSGSNTAPTFTDYDDDGLYIRTAPSDALQGPVLANTIVNDGWSNVAIVARADDYGRGLANATADALENAGATVALNETYDPLAQQYDSVVQAVVSAQPDAVVVVAFEEGVQIIQGLIEAGITPADTGFYAADGMRNPDLGSLVNEADPSVLAGMKGTAPASAANDDFLSSLAEFAPELGDNTQFAPQVYDCAVVVALAADAAGSADAQEFKSEVVNVTKDGTECTSYAECKDLIDAGEDIDYQGVSGPLDFTDAGEPGRASIEVYGFDDAGKFESIETVESNPAADSR